MPPPRPVIYNKPAHLGFKYPAFGSRAALYRAFLRNLRFLPDPHLWMMLQPAMREYCRSRPVKYSLEEVNLHELVLTEGQEKTKQIVQSDLERKKSLASARDLMNDVRAAVAVHPHALARLVEEAYGQRGPLRFKLMRNISKTSPPSNEPRPDEHLLGPYRQPLPPPLECLRYTLPVNPNPYIARARARVPPTEGKRKARLRWIADQNLVQIPLIMPKGSGAATGWEDSGIVESLRILAGVGDTILDHGHHPSPPRRTRPEDLPPSDAIQILGNPSQLPTFQHLSPVLKRIFPIKVRPTYHEARYPKPGLHETKGNPHTWHQPENLDYRMIQRAYARLWDTLAWSHPMTAGGEKWVQCDYDSMRDWEEGKVAPWDRGEKKPRSRPRESFKEQTQKWSNASPKERRWLQESFSPGPP